MSNTSPSQPPARDPMPVSETAAEVVRTFLSLLAYLPRLALVPFTATFLTQGALLLFAAPAMPGGADQPPQLGLPHLLGAVVVAAAYVMFLVDWHRLVLLGPGPETTRPRLRFARRDLRYFGYGLLVGLLSALASLPAFILVAPFSGALGGPLPALLIGVLLAVTAMIALGIVLPAAAVDKRLGIPDAFDATKRVLAKLLALAIIILLPLQIIVVFFTLISQMLAHSLGFVIPLLFIALAVEYTTAAIFATLLSVVYRRRIGM
ncbi:hypothetical protein DRB17_18470 [Ferruginivarius sediminum]|uniref:Glycerophosphoryl diester phosphodiesterase membrane domain-containing protein n=2 Tax=Ferruginivarius sediminum TaxID=2661937 RepID=A0A369T844_9PROT|nr:hypothetical protein DRB17_18470 [Ferruginivarius sediminum]